MLVPTTVSLSILSASTLEYAEQPFIAMLCKPHTAEYKLQYMDYDTIQAYIELMMDCKDQTTRRNAFDHLWDYLMGEGV